MKLTKNEWLFGAGRRMWLGLGVCLMGMALGRAANAQAVSTTTVQGTVYLANGQAGAGTLDVSWPAFTTANNKAVTAGRMSVTIAPDGFVSVNLAPNLGATPAGLYYTAVYHMSDGTTSTEYWVVPAAAQASLGQVRAQLMPAAQAVQAVSKAYVDQAIAVLTGSLLTASGGTLSGPLYLNGDPTQPLQAADKHYVDTTFNMEVPIAGGSMTGPLTAPAVNGVQSPAAGSAQTTLQATISAAGSNGAMEIPPTYAGTDGFTNPNGVRVMDLRPGGAQPTERSVKEFGAVCNGVTDDTNALQAALNFAQAHGVALTIPQGTCKTQSLNWHGESIGGMGKQVSALMGFPGQDVLSTVTDSTNLLANTRIHDLTIFVDQSVDVSCSAAEGRAAAGSCALGRLLENNTIFSAGGNGLTGTAGTGAGWAVGNCAIAMPAATGTGGNGLRVAEIENLAIAATGVDPMAAQYPGAHSTHTCGLYLAQWPQWSEFRNIDIRGVNTGIAIPALPVTAPAGLNADSNRWQNITIQATHGFTAAAGSNNVLDNVVALAANSAATGEPPTGLVLDFAGSQQGWTVRNAVVLPSWNAVQPQLALTASGGAVTGVTAGPEHGLGFDPYGTQVPLKFSGSCTAQATANVNSDGSLGSISVTQGGTGCSGTTTASVNAAGTWDTSAPVNLISGQSMSFFGGNLLKGNGGYTVWNATGSQSYETQLDGGGGTLRGGGSYAGLVANSQLGTANPVDQFPGADFGAKLQACLNTLSVVYGGTCDARNFTGTQSMGSNLTISTANATVLLPCATISTASQVIVTAGTRNATLRGCALRGASNASGSQGGTVFLYSGTGAMVQVGDPTYATNTMGFHLDNAVINTTASNSATAQGLTAYRTQEMDLESLYFLGNQNQTGMTLDGTGNYTGGTYFDNAISGFQTAVNAIGHQISNPATTDWVNASTFVRLHIDCPTSGGNPIAGTYGINLQQGDGNTFTGGDVEGCSTALHLGPNAQSNTIVGLRNENSSSQVVADAGSAYNNWMTGGTMFTGALTDNGTRNSFLDTFHRSFNGIKGDWYGSQQDATVTNHYRLGIGAGNERGLYDRYQTDYGYRWTMGLSDATAGEQFYQILDELNNVYRFSIGQYNNGQSSTNNQTVINSAGTGAIVLNGSNSAGTGGVVFGSGGTSASTVATINNAGNAQFNGTLQVGGATTFTATPTVKNQANAEIDATLWAGLTTSQKESFIYKDWNGNSQWYLVKDASNNWALNSAVGGLDSIKAYQSTNSGDTYIGASNSTGAVRVNYETGSGTAFNIYGGGSSTLYASFTGTTSIKFPGLAASSGHYCLQIDNSGYITNTGATCGTGNTNGTVSVGTSGQIAYYGGNGTAISGISAVPLTAGGTGAATASAALANLGVGAVSVKNYGATGNGVTDDTTAIQSAITAVSAQGVLGAYPPLYFPRGTYKISAVLRMPAYIHALGDGYAASTILQTCAACNLFTVFSNGNSLPAGFFGGGIDGLTLAGNGHLSTGTLLELQNTGGYTLSDILFYNSGGRGITLAENSERSKFNNLYFQSVRWPEVFNAYEIHNVGLTVMGAGGTADGWCFGINCFNGQFPGPGGQTLIQAIGNGLGQGYVLSGTSPVQAGNYVRFTGITGTPALNGYYKVVTAANNTPTSGEFTLTVSGTANGTGTVGSATFAVALIPDNRHAAVWSAGQQQSFQNGEIKPATDLPAFKFAGTEGTKLDNFYLEGYINSINPDLILGGLPDQLIGAGTLTTRTIGSTTYPVIPVADTSWWPAYINDFNDIPANTGDHPVPVAIMCADYRWQSTTACAANPSVQQGQVEYAMALASSDGNAYLTARNQSGSTAPANTVWVNPVIDYAGANALSTGSALIAREDSFFSTNPESFQTGYVPYCADGQFNQCADIQLGPIPDGYYVHFGSTSADNISTGLGALTLINGFAPNVGSGNDWVELTGNGWIKAATNGTLTLVGNQPGGNAENGEINTSTLTNIHTIGVTYAAGPVAYLTINGDQQNYSNTKGGYFEQSINAFDANLAANPNQQPGGGGWANGHQFANSTCWYDTGAGTTSGTTAHALNRFCMKGSPSLTGTNAGWEYDTWSGSGWVNAFSVSPSSLQALHYQSITTPTVAVGAGAGTGASATISGSDFAADISITAGSSPAAGTVATVSFGNAYSSPPHCVTKVNGGAAYLGEGWSASSTALTVTTATAIPGGVTKMSYLCGQ